jgi:predicted O-linked N-acetylglucosamine transferase (SPINDLY family)
MVLQFVSPSSYAHIYSEKLVHLPHCYFVNDYKQVCLHASSCLLFLFLVH